MQLTKDREAGHGRAGADACTNLMNSERCSVSCHEVEVGVLLLLVEIGDGVEEGLEVGFRRRKVVRQLGRVQESHRDV